MIKYGNLPSPSYLRAVRRTIGSIKSVISTGWTSFTGFKGISTSKLYFKRCFINFSNSQSIKYKLYLIDYLARPPYAAAFFYSYVNQEYLDDQIPEIQVLREALKNVTKFDFTLLHNEFQGFQRLKADIIKRFPQVTSYHEFLGCLMAQKELYLVTSIFYWLKQDLTRLRDARYMAWRNDESTFPQYLIRSLSEAMILWKTENFTWYLRIRYFLMLIYAGAVFIQIQSSNQELELYVRSNFVRSQGVRDAFLIIINYFEVTEYTFQMFKPILNRGAIINQPLCSVEFCQQGRELLQILMFLRWNIIKDFIQILDRDIIRILIGIFSYSQKNEETFYIPPYFKCILQCYKCYRRRIVWL